MRTIRAFERIIFFVATLLLAGCASTIQYPPFPDQTKTVVDPAKARIYLIRKEKFVGSAVGIKFFGAEPDVATGPLVGSNPKSRLVGEVGPASYLCWEQVPGPFIFAKIDDDPRTRETLNLEAGKVYYLRLYLHSGWTRVTARAEVIDAPEGQKLLKHCKPPNDYRKK